MCDTASDNATKKKRGRRPKSSMLLVGNNSGPEPDDDQPSFVESCETPQAAAISTKRGRKPKAIYNASNMEENLERVIHESDNDNIIMKLCIKPGEVRAAEKADAGCGEYFDAYNEGIHDSFQCKPYELELQNTVESLGGTSEHMSEIDDSYKTPGTGTGLGEMNLKVVQLLKDFEKKNRNNEWPMSTSIHCYWCCHGFDNPPYGIPVRYFQKRFYVYGCFCSLECASAYNIKSNDGIDQIVEHQNLMNMLSRRIGYVEAIKPAPDRLALRMFGGYMDIAEFRQFCRTSKLLNVNFPPMMTLTQQLEEINQCDMDNEYKYIPIDTERINKYKEKIKLKRTKPLTNFKNTLDHAMNLKFGS